MKKSIEFTQLLPLLAVGLITLAFYEEYEIYSKLCCGLAIILVLIWTKNNQSIKK